MLGASLGDEKGASEVDVDEVAEHGGLISLGFYIRARSRSEFGC